MKAPDLSPVLARLSALYARDHRLRTETADQRTETATGWGAMPYTPKQPPSRLESVTDAATGTRYAAWVIGETLAAIGGREMMDRAFDAFAAEHGGRGASWLDHRWNGVEVGPHVWCA